MVNLQRECELMHSKGRRENDLRCFCGVSIQESFWKVEDPLASQPCPGVGIRADLSSFSKGSVFLNDPGDIRAEVQWGDN